MQPINLIMFYYWDKHNGGHLEQLQKKNASFELDTSNKWFYLLFYQFPGHVIIF